jgi:hypothetical protein
MEHVSMEPFINRETELRLIDSALDDLLDRERLLRTPIIDFYGIKGIGKTRLLNATIQKCDAKQIPCITIAIDQDPPIEQSIADAKTRLKQGSLVMLFDSVDATNERQIVQLEKMLNELVIHNNLFIILTSNGSVSFKQGKSIERKLTTFLLEPFDYANSNLYLDSLDYTLKPDIRDLIFEWTHGYPLAMEVIVEAITEKMIDPTNDQGKKELITFVVEQVINKGILAKVKPDELAWFQTTLNLLAVPRRFNLVIMQKLIEYFEPELKLASSLSYIVLPKRIFQATGMLDWNIAKAGFALDDSIRHILLLQLKMLHPHRYHEINSFLAEVNWSNTIETSGSDRVRYQLEYLYHSANSVEEKQLAPLLETTIQQIILDAKNAPDQLIQFREEFILDNELKEALGTYAIHVLDQVEVNLAQEMYTAATLEKVDEKRIRYLHNFFTYAIRDSTLIDLPEDLQENMRQLLSQESRATLVKLEEELALQSKLSSMLERTFPMLFTHPDNSRPAEG